MGTFSVIQPSDWLRETIIDHVTVHVGHVNFIQPHGVQAHTDRVGLQIY